MEEAAYQILDNGATTTAVELAQVSQAISLKRIADVLETLKADQSGLMELAYQAGTNFGLGVEHGRKR
jgi:hypothetical protein